MFTFKFLHTLLCVALCFCAITTTTELNAFSTENELFPVEIIPPNKPNPGDTIQFVVQLPQSRFSDYSDTLTNGIYAKIFWEEDDRSPQNVTVLRLTQKQIGENKFYATWVIPKKIITFKLYTVNREWDNLAQMAEVYLHQDSTTSYYREREKIFQSEEMMEQFIRIRRMHPHNLEPFALLWQRYKRSKEEIEQQIDSLAFLFPQHPHLTELRLFKDIIYFDTSAAMIMEMQKYLDTILLRDNLRMFTSPVYNNIYNFLLMSFPDSSGTKKSFFAQYIIEFTKKQAHPSAIMPYIRMGENIEPNVLHELFRSVPAFAEDPLFQLHYCTKQISWILNNKQSKEALPNIKAHLLKIINIVYKDDFFESNVSYDPFYLWMIRYWAYQYLSYVHKLQAEYDEAISVLDEGRKEYPVTHQRNGEAFYDMALLFLAKGDTVNYLQHLIRAERLFPTFPFPKSDLKNFAKNTQRDFVIFYDSLQKTVPFITSALPKKLPNLITTEAGLPMQVTGQRSRPAIFIFTNSTCGPCKILFNEIIKKLNEQPDRYNIDICLVFRNDDKGFNKYVMQNKHISDKLNFAQSSEMHFAFNISGVPDIAVINSNGEMSAYIKGAGKDNNIESLLSAAK